VTFVRGAKEGIDYKFCAKSHAIFPMLRKQARRYAYSSGLVVRPAPRDEYPCARVGIDS